MKTKLLSRSQNIFCLSHRLDKNQYMEKVIQRLLYQVKFATIKKIGTSEVVNAIQHMVQGE